MQVEVCGCCCWSFFATATLKRAYARSCSLSKLPPICWSPRGSGWVRLMLNLILYDSLPRDRLSIFDSHPLGRFRLPETRSALSRKWSPPSGCSLHFWQPFPVRHGEAGAHSYRDLNWLVQHAYLRQLGFEPCNTTTSSSLIYPFGNILL